MFGLDWVCFTFVRLTHTPFQSDEEKNNYRKNFQQRQNEVRGPPCPLMTLMTLMALMILMAQMDPDDHDESYIYSDKSYLVERTIVIKVI